MQPPEVFYKKSVLKKFAIFRGKHLCWQSLFNEIAGSSGLFWLTGAFSVTTANFLRTSILKNVCANGCFCKAHMVQTEKIFFGSYNLYCARFFIHVFLLTLLRRRPSSYRNQYTDLLCKSMDWFLYDNGFRHEKVKYLVHRVMIVKMTPG